MPHKIELYGVIGIDWWGVSAKTLIQQLSEIEQADDDDNDVELHINSGGGYVNDAMAMFNRLKAHPGKVHVKIDALAASAATLVAMAGDTIEMPDNATFMVHQPWGVGIGTSEELSKSAELLDKTEAKMVRMYAKRTGLAEDEIRDLLEAETWMDAEEALEYGFVTSIVEADEEDDIEARRDEAAQIYATVVESEEGLRSYKNPPAWARTTNSHKPAPLRAVASDAKKEPSMGTKNEKGNDKQTSPAPQANAPEPAAPQAAPAVDVEAALKADRARAKAIQEKGQALGVALAVVAQLVEDGVPLNDAKAAMTDWLAENKKTVNSSINVDVDGRDNNLAGMQAALEYQAGVTEDRKLIVGNPYAGMSLSEIAMGISGERTKKRAIEAVIDASRQHRADTGITHTTSDFTYLTTNIATKALLKGWDEAPETFPIFTNRGSLPDFKAASRVGINGISSLEEVPQSGQVPLGTLSDRGTTIQLGEFAKRIGMTRKLMLNDDLSALGRVPMALGRAGRRTIGDKVFGIIINNADFEDGTPLFHADHGNLAAAAALSETSLAAALKLMRVQKDPETGAALNIQATYLMVPAALEHTARKLVEAVQLDNDTNIYKGSLELIVDGRLDADSDTAWYLIASATTYDTIEVAYLNGMEAPLLTQRVGFEVEGIEWKVNLDFGVGTRDFRTFVRNLGA